MQSRVSTIIEPNRRSMGFSNRPLLLLLCLLCAQDNFTFGDDQVISKEYQIKAAYLYNFTKFVEWPVSAFSSDESPIIIGVFGKSPFGRELKQVVEGRKVNARRFEIKEVDHPGDVKTVHLLFIPASEDSRVAELLLQLQGSSVLTVGESSRFLESGGIIRFVHDQDKIRFDIGIDSAQKSNLKISAQLQKLARVLRCRT